MTGYHANIVKKCKTVVDLSQDLSTDKNYLRVTLSTSGAKRDSP